MTDRYDSAGGTVFAYLDDDTQVATVHDNTRGGGFARGTLVRVLNISNGKRFWVLQSLAGRELYRWRYEPPYQSLIDSVARQLSAERNGTI